MGVVVMMPVVMRMLMSVCNRAMSMGMRVSGRVTSFFVPGAR